LDEVGKDPPALVVENLFKISVEAILLKVLAKLIFHSAKPPLWTTIASLIIVRLSPILDPL
jgi:hypothetical protein